MNPLTLVKRIQKITSTEAALGISEDASWHAKYKDSAYVFVGGIPFDLTEGDLLAIFAQYGEVVDVNLVKDKATGKSRGFAFLAYEDQRSTILAVDNLNGAKVLGRIIRVDHVSSYKRKVEEDEETEREKKEARGVCRAFQRGGCNRGSACKFSHDEQRCANTGWGAKDDSRWGHDKYDGPPKSLRSLANDKGKVEECKPRFRDKDGRYAEEKTDDYYSKNDGNKRKSSSVNHERVEIDELHGRARNEARYRGEMSMEERVKDASGQDMERKVRRQSERRQRDDDKDSGRLKLEKDCEVNADMRGSEKRSRMDKDLSNRHVRDNEDRDRRLRR